MRSTQEFYDEFEPPEGDEPSRLARVRRALSTAIGALVALSLLLALGVWFYRLGVRDAENVPIIRASAEPAKIRPEDPGGAVAPHQEITSYRVAESQPAQASAAVIAPPPPEPRAEDVAMGTLAPEPAERPAAPTAASPAPTAAPVVAMAAAGSAQPPVTSPKPQPTPAEAAAAIASGAVLARTEATVSAAPVPVPPQEPSPAGETVLAMAEPAEAAASALDVVPPAPPQDPVPGASDYAPPLSPVAPRRPTDLRERMAAAVQTAQQNATDLARRAAESSVQVQLAADPSEDVVRSMWGRISQANSDLLHGRELAVQTTISGGTTFYRLRVGPFGGVSEARAVCQALKARGQDCIVARNG